MSADHFLLSNRPLFAKIRRHKGIYAHQHPHQVSKDLIRVATHSIQLDPLITPLDGAKGIIVDQGISGLVIPLDPLFWIVLQFKGIRTLPYRPSLSSLTDLTTLLATKRLNYNQALTVYYIQVRSATGFGVLLIDRNRQCFTLLYCHY